jgi:ribonuclease PH
MMPGSVGGRIAPARNNGGRAEEISRLIGRSLRAAVDFKALGERTITIDAQVVQADGGTRTAGVTGGYIALALALRELHAQGLIASPDPRCQIAAVSAGMVGGRALLDLAQVEDSSADSDLNVVMTAQGEFIEVQGTAEGAPLERGELERLLALAESGIRELLALQTRILADRK